MKRLDNNKIDLLKEYLRNNNVSGELYDEILDHLACEAEEQLWDGRTFEKALEQIVTEADAQTLRFLNVEHKHLLAMENSLNDIVFENRNKQYGAYDLRKGYGETVQRSVILGVTAFLLMVMLPNLYARLKPTPKADEIAFEGTLEHVDIRPDEPKIATPIPPAEPIKTTVKYVNVQPTQDYLVEHDTPPPVVEDLQNAAPGQETVAGTDGDIDIIEPPVSGVADAKLEKVEVKPESNAIFTIVEQNPNYVGGMRAMGEFLSKNIRYPRPAADAGIEGKVILEFVVSNDGKIQNVKTLKGIGFGCDEEAERVIKLMPAWNPGKQNGRAVNVKFVLPVAFQLN